jgi:hypothetical protein
VKQVSSLGRTLCESSVSQSQDQLLARISLTAASEELSAVPSRAIVHQITTECQELLHLVLELNFPYDAHPIFSPTDCDEEALSQAREPFPVPHKLAVLCVDFSDSGIPGSFSYRDLETREILKLNSQS